MDTSTLLIVLLLVSAASLASYALSHWSSIRGGISNLGWAATSIGTTLLLTAAAIVVLTLVFRAMLWPPSAQTEQASNTALEPTAASDFTRSELPTDGPSKAADQTHPATARRVDNRRDDDPTSVASRVRQQQSLEASIRAATELNRTRRDSAPLPVFAHADPWAATRCVHVFNPDLDDSMRWKVENECDAPVGIVLSTRGSWEYPTAELIFPAKLQRPITHDEQTLHGKAVSYVACFVETSAASQLVGADSEERTSPQWREQFDAARLTDGCLSRLQNTSRPGDRLTNHRVEQ